MMLARNLLYSSIADDYMWFDSWMGVMDLPHWERPLKLNFGDDEVMTREEKQQFVDVFDAHGIPIYWRQGDISVICNFRTAHGRPGFKLENGEKRELGVVLGETFARVGDLPDKWTKSSQGQESLCHTYKTPNLSKIDTSTSRSGSNILKAL